MAAFAAAYDMKKIRAEFGRVLETELLSTNTIITRLSQDKPTSTYFMDLASSLPAIDVDESTGIVHFSKKRQPFQAVGRRPVGSGTFGTIFKSVDGRTIYKKIEIQTNNPREIEEKAREIFVEAFIQTVLSCDQVYGNNVCKIRKLYRSKEYKLARGRAAGAGGAGAPYSIILYIVMEPMHSDMHHAFQTLFVSNGGVKMTKGVFLPMMKKLGEILHHFESVYGFHHRDLHNGNIMFRSLDDLNEPVLIDFGLSCLTLEDTTYSFIVDNVLDEGNALVPKVVGMPCESLDLLILAVCLYEFSSEYIDGECMDFLRRSTQGQNGNFLIDALPVLNVGGRYPALFHMVYPYVILEPTGALFANIAPYMPFKHIDPALFASFAQQYLMMIGGRRRTFRKQRTRRSRRRRRASIRHRKH